MYYLIYKITNKINGKYYIGCHKTEDINDNYMGSGRAIQNAIKKYGKDNFIKEILFECSSVKEMFDKEKEIVSENIVNDRLSYNLKLGGTANFYYVNKNHLNHKSNQHLILADKLKNDEEYRKAFVNKMTEINKVNGYKRRGLSPNNKDKLLVYKDNDSRFINKNEYEKYSNEGWHTGKYSYVCKRCGKIFYRKKKKRGNDVYCSLECYLKDIKKNP